MGNLFEKSTSKYLINEQNLDYLEGQLLEFSGLKKDELKVKNVKIGEYKNQNIYLRTIICGNGNSDNIQNNLKPILVLVHGYAGSGTLFYKIMKKLSEKFILILIDILGMGGSARPDDYQKNSITPQQSIDYFVESIEKWRQAMNISQFFLAGHSFGGYIVGNYSLKYHTHLKKLLLISPIGIRVPNEGESWQQRMELKTQNGAGPPKWVRFAVKFIWEQKLSPFGLARFLGQKQSVQMISKYVKNKQKCGGEEENQAIIDYMYQILLRPGTTEYSIQVMFDPALQAHHPLGTDKKLASSEFPIPISFYYGDQDWVLYVDENAADICVSQNKKKHGQHKSINYCVQNAGHNMHMDNPQELAQLIITDTEQ